MIKAPIRSNVSILVEINVSLEENLNLHLKKRNSFMLGSTGGRSNRAESAFNLCKD